MPADAAAPKRGMYERCTEAAHRADRLGRFEQAREGAAGKKLGAVFGQ
ncbi:hypothetical protein J2797_006267 [Paraburkholderia terricola]|nr:hypothetical protein [Paraburkholderia terricola]MDR6496340.1 hypothetical protein [Paraburkholderia terricola]